MASIFKREGKRNWYIDYFDHTGKRISRSSGTSDKQAATRIANKLETDVSLRKERVVDPAIEDMAKIATMPLKVHLDDYGAALDLITKSLCFKIINMTSKMIRFQKGVNGIADKLSSSL